jgi:hypothetical protein
MLEQLSQQQILVVVLVSLGISLIRAYMGYEKSKQDFDFIHYMQTVKYYAIATIPVIGALAIEQTQGGGELSIINLVLAAAGAGTLGEILRVGVKKTILSNETIEPQPARNPDTGTTASVSLRSNGSTVATIPEKEAPNDISSLHYDHIKTNINNEGRIYQNNFVQGKDGNKIPYGSNLKIKIDGATLVSGRLAKLTENGPQALQIEQSFAPNNPWPDMVKFELLDWIENRPVPMKPGRYTVTVWYVRNGREGRITDDFEIE